ncbi:MAG: TonB-dependent receptor, partial [Ignavibacteriae bacterium]
MKFIICTFLMLFIVDVSTAQLLTGKIYELDEGNKKLPLAGSNIYWRGTQIGTTSNNDGYFELLKVDSSELYLVVSYIGYKADTVQVPFNQDSIEITLSINREISEVVVTGISFSKFVDELDAKPTEIITSKELLKAACCNLSESFSTNTSVDIQFQDAVTGAKQIQLLGLAGNYTQIMFENIPTLNGIANTFGLGYVPGPWMTGISISKGAASVVNGYESITGQINIDYKKPDDIERYYFNAFQSSHFKTDLNANAAVHLTENMSTMLLAHTNFRAKAIDDNQDSFADQPKVKQFNFLNRWKYESFNGHNAQFGIQILNEERRGGQVTSNAQGQRYEMNVDSKHIEMFAKNGFVFNAEPYSSLGLILDGHIHQQNSLIGLRQYDAKQSSFYSNLLFEARTYDEIHSVTIGGSYVFDQYKEEFDSLNFFRKESRPGLFVEYNFSPSNLLSVVPGARIDFHNLYGTFFTPRIHIKYSLDYNTTFRVSAGKGVRSVNLISENL